MKITDFTNPQYLSSEFIGLISDILDGRENGTYRIRFNNAKYTAELTVFHPMDVIVVKNENDKPFRVMEFSHLTLDEVGKFKIWDATNLVSKQYFKDGKRYATYDDQDFLDLVIGSLNGIFSTLALEIFTSVDVYQKEVC